MKAALIQLNSSDNPADNLIETQAYVADAAARGAQFVLTPEVTNCVSASRARQQEVLCAQQDDPTLAALQSQAKDLGIWVLIGSLGLKTDDPDGRFANRSFLVGPDGHIQAQYDKIHMFDVQVTPEETYRESDGYRPGEKAVVAHTPFANIGMTVCYDIRFPHLYQKLALAGANILTVPAAFSHVTGKAHWESLLRSRAIENGCFVMAPAQTGAHKASVGMSRTTHGHSMVVAPWGEVLLDAGTEPGVHLVDFDMSEVAKARKRVMSLTHIRPFSGPE
jgi:deaminated glutathione amidase